MPPPTADAALTVLVIDDDEQLRGAVRELLRTETGIDLVGETGDPYEAYQLWRSMRADVIVLDERMETLNGLTVAARILADDPTQDIVMLTAHPSRELYAAASMLGVRDVLDKLDLAQLPDAVRRHDPRDPDRDTDLDAV